MTSGSRHDAQFRVEVEPAKERWRVNVPQLAGFWHCLNTEQHPVNATGTGNAGLPKSDDSGEPNPLETLMRQALKWVIVSLFAAAWMACNTNLTIDCTGTTCPGPDASQSNGPDSGGPCVPKTCIGLGRNCGTVWDGCGGLIDCGTCTAPDSCGGGGEPNVCGQGVCTPESDEALCSTLGKTCGTLTAVDNCGSQRTVSSCGTCTSPETCGGGGTANVCGQGSCTPESNTAFCESQGKNCGAFSGMDNCGNPRSANCGSCLGNETCGGGGTPNVCGCSDGCVADAGSPDGGSMTGDGGMISFCDGGFDFQDDWPKWHHDRANTGRSQANTCGLTGIVAWKFNVGLPPSGSNYINSPVVDAAGNVYQLGLTGTLYAVSPTGTQLWSVLLTDSSQDPHPSTPALLADGSMYVLAGGDTANAAGVNQLYVVSSSGQILSQQYLTQDGFDACPNVGADGTLYLEEDLGAGTPQYEAIALQFSGATISQTLTAGLNWTVDTERVGSAIADDGTSYWCANAQCFALLPPGQNFTAVTTWPSGGITIPGPNGLVTPFSDLAIDSQVSLLITYTAWENLGLTGTNSVQGTVVAVNPITGATQWTLPLPLANLTTNLTTTLADYGNAAPAIGADGTIYVGNGDGLRAINGASGTVIWLFSSANVTSSPAIGGDGTIFFGTQDGNLYAVYANGTLRFKVITGAQVSSSPAIAGDGTVYVTSDDGNLYSIK
jgi:outer membrane protein assembly factor BamB